MQSENDSLVRNHKDTGDHFTEEIIAQAICQAYASERNLNGRVYAVGRRCHPDTHACNSICASPYLHVQDSQTVHYTWSCINAYHVYGNRLATSYGRRNNAVLGLKSKGERCDIRPCGPNYCCCYAAYASP